MEEPPKADEASAGAEELKLGCWNICDMRLVSVVVVCTCVEGVLAETVVKEVLEETEKELVPLLLLLEGVAGSSFEVMEGSKVVDSGDPESKDRGGKTGVGTDGG